ncbi:RnfABCDGE type electron transport complex subunit D [Paludibacter sp. 221]|uniref:RnfABCDGE type electron transport complex subunit D n=1 Tax=Paludibacter sp. 221 TaxID=2302939 RepID=UPI0013D0CDD8|nr:RnfABCDGE type electron transport complex subunit D [Paludibacter sp. 221]NDV46548.1 RnfABCDGE type electron transport complex subunit D [Paludibacter sp. 221]
MNEQIHNPAQQKSAEKLLVVSPAPHIHSGDSISKNMLGVIIALIPAYLVALYFFGLGALIVSITAVISCMLFEYLIQRFLFRSKSVTIGDGSAILTGLLLSFNLPSNLPVWMVVLGALVAIGIGKMSFGGLGNNPFNPALVGRVFLLISFPVQMTSWPRPIPMNMQYLDAETGPTVLAMIKNHFGQLPETTDMLIGNMGGSLGEVSAIALLIGLAYMLIRKIITWHIPVSILFTVFAFTGILYLVNPETYASPLVHLLTGGLLLGAIFMATDYVTSPMSKVGMIIYGIGIGIITVVIRVFGAYPEGVSFAILIMNAFTPLINAYIKPKRFGEKIKK